MKRGYLVRPGQHRPDPRGDAGGRLAEDDAPGYGQDNRGAVTRCAGHRECGADACRALAHATQTEMPVLPALDHRRLHAYAVVRDSDCEAVAVAQGDVDTIAARVRVRVANRLVADSIDLVPDASRWRPR
jgi:hypothetical protein